MGHEEVSSLRVVVEVKDVETLLGGQELNDTFVRENAENPVVVMAVISDVVFFGEAKK
jgi:hypothetical protein